MIQIDFANRVKKILEDDENVIGLAAGGSWIDNAMDEFSDLDLVIVTHKKIAPDKEHMIEFARRLGDYISGFTGDHVGEPRLLICLYSDPLLHVDLKFVTLDEFHHRVENPVILLDKGEKLKAILDNSKPQFPFPDYQWIEDRFWTWIHYALLKIGRGEYFEALDFLAFLRGTVLGPLLHIKSKNLPRGVRKVETDLQQKDLDVLKGTIAAYDKQSLISALQNSIQLYRNLREELFDNTIVVNTRAEQEVMKYFAQLTN